MRNFFNKLSSVHWHGWLVFAVSTVVLAGFYFGYVSLSSQATRPEVSHEFDQTHRSLSLRAEIKNPQNHLATDFLSSTASPGQWRYLVTTSNSLCQASNIAQRFNQQSSDVRLADVSFAHDNKQASVDIDYPAGMPNSLDDKYLCFEIVYGQRDSSVTREYFKYVATKIDLDKPSIIISQYLYGATITANDKAGQQGLSLRYDKFASQPACNASDRGNLSYAFSNATTNLMTSQFQLEDSDHGAWLCVNVSDSQGNHVYRKFQIDFRSPGLTLSQQGENNEQLRVTATDSTDIRQLLYRRVKVFNPSGDYAGECASLDLNNSAWQAEGYQAVSVQSNNQGRTYRYTLPLDVADNNHLYCFYARDTQGNHVFAGKAIQNVREPIELPTITADQTVKNTIEVSASDKDGQIDPATWLYVFQNQDFACDESTSSNLNWLALPRSQSHIININKQAHNNYYFCFRVSNQDSPAETGYKKMKVDYNPPEIDLVIRTVVRNGVVTPNQITATASDDYVGVDDNSWSYYSRANAQTKCETAALSWVSANSQHQTVNLRSSDTNYYFCFRVKDKLNNYGYEKIKVAPPVAPPTNELTVFFTVVNNRLTASVVGGNNNNIKLYTWDYVTVASDQINCQQEIYSSAAHYSKRYLNVTPQNHGSFYCFKVFDSGQNKVGYGRTQVLYNNDGRPQVYLERVKHTIVATASGINVDPNSWTYARVRSDVTACNRVSYRSERASQNVINVVKADENYHFCVRVSTRDNLHGYAKIQIASVDNPVLTHQLAGNVITAQATDGNGIDGQTWSFARSASQPGNCSLLPATGYAPVSARNRVVNLNPADNRHYYCFKVSDTLGNDGYRLVGPVTYAPRDQRGLDFVKQVKSDRLIVTVDSLNSIDTDTWQYTRSQDYLTCRGDNRQLTFNPASPDNDRLVLTTKDNGYYYCFRVRLADGSRHIYGQVYIDELVIKTADYDYQYVTSDSELACDKNDFTDESQITYMAGEHDARAIVDAIPADERAPYYCFRDKQANGSYKYTKVIVTAQPTAPTEPAPRRTTPPQPRIVPPVRQEEKKDGDMTGITTNQQQSTDRGTVKAADEEEEKDTATFWDDVSDNWVLVAVGLAGVIVIITAVVKAVKANNREDDMDDDGFGGPIQSNDDIDFSGDSDLQEIVDDLKTAPDKFSIKNN